MSETGDEGSDLAVQQALLAVAPLLQGVVAVCEGHEEIRAEVEGALQNMAARPEWAGLSAALQRVLDGERDATKLLAGLDQSDQVALMLTAAAASGDGEAHQDLATLVQKRQDQERHEEAEQFANGFQAWLATPEGQAASQELEAQGVDSKQRMVQLIKRFAVRSG